MTSPCPTCTTLADCSSCPAYDDWLATLDPPEPHVCHTCTDVEWLLLCGEGFDQIAGRLNMKRASLITHLYRHGRPELAPATRRMERTP